MINDDRTKAKELRKEGKTLREICEILDRPIGTISVWCRGIKSPKNHNHKKGYRVYPKETKEEALDRVKEGESLEEVARSLQIPPMTIRSWCEKDKIEFRQRSRYNPNLRDEALELRNQGLSFEEIQKKLDIGSLHTLMNWFKHKEQ